MMKKLTALVLTLALCLTAALAVAETDKTYIIGIAGQLPRGLHSGPGRDGLCGR